MRDSDVLLELYTAGVIDRLGKDTTTSSQMPSNFSFFFFFFVGVGCLGLTCISVDGLCPEEGFKGVRVSRSIVVVVLVGFLA